MTPKPPKKLVTELARGRDELFKEHLSGLSGLESVRRCTAWADRSIAALFDWAAQERPDLGQNFSLMALGGYGRGELNLQSDIDLLFLHASSTSKTQVEEAAQMILYPLWDLGLDVGHGTRDLGDSLALAESDFTVLVSLLTARRLAGSERIGAQLAPALTKVLASDRAKRRFLDRVTQADQERQAKFGHTPYLLEPHIKEGEGGLRDIHVIGWIGLGCLESAGLKDLIAADLLNAEEATNIRDTQSFWWRVRNHLHYLAKARDDRLTFERQEQIASFFGYREKDGVSPVERFMRDYYRRAYGMRNIRSLFFERAEARLAVLPQGPTGTVDGHFNLRDHKLGLAHPEGLIKDPTIMMSLFATASRMGRKVSYRARMEVHQMLDLVGDEFRYDPRAAKSFFTVLIPERAGDTTLFAMHASDLLVTYLPELKRVFHLPQHDAYHIYTVDTHQLVTVHRLNELRLGKGEPGEDLAKKIIDSLDDYRVLYLAALCHDIGKGGGKDHSAVGAEIVADVGPRLGLTEDETELLRFLVANHLYLNITANRRDIHDEKQVFAAARRIGTPERLDLLYLLTIADALATGPTAWSSWKSMLVRELYLRTRAVYSRPDITDLGTVEWLDQLKDAVSTQLAPTVDRDKVEQLMEECSDQYLLATPSEVIAEHLRLQSRLPGKNLVFKVEEFRSADYCQITAVAKKRVGLFGRLAGVLTLNGFNILGAQIYTRRSRVSVEVFQVEFPLDDYGLAKRWAKVEEDMNRVLTGRLALGARIMLRRRQFKQVNGNSPNRKPKVKVLNDVSDVHTVLEVHAQDRMGLLYDITQVLYDLDLEIHIAKISTDVDQVVDTFYVTALDGSRAESEGQIEEIKWALTGILE